MWIAVVFVESLDILVEDQFAIVVLCLGEVGFVIGLEELLECHGARWDILERNSCF